MVRWLKVLGIAIALASPACTAARQQVAEAPGVESSYVDPWGTPVAWSTVPAPSSAPGATPAVEPEEAKPKVEDEPTPVVEEPEPTPSAGDLGGDEDSDD